MQQHVSLLHAVLSQQLTDHKRLFVICGLRGPIAVTPATGLYYPVRDERGALLEVRYLRFLPAGIRMSIYGYAGQRPLYLNSPWTI